MRGPDPRHLGEPQVLIGGLILPHPPVILPAYAGSRDGEVEETISAVRNACAWLAELRPERLLIASPHVGHGFDVPLHFLGEALGRELRVERVLTDDPAYDTYQKRGEQLSRLEAGERRRTAVIASGDCSHMLSPDGPYGFDASGPLLDDAIQAGLRAGRADDLLSIERSLVEAGGECGLRAFVFALAALRPERVEILSYQAPFGVGYLVARLHAREE